MFLSGKEVWKALSAAARHPRGRRYVATPYLTEDAVRAVALERGDVLLCALSLADCRNGSIDPRAVGRLQAKGVRVFSLDTLHAKVYLLGRQAFVGSANLTQRSLSVLEEAVVRVSDPETIRRIREWFEERLHTPVQSTWLAKCVSAYRPPRVPGGGRRKAVSRPAIERPRGVLLASTTPRIDSERDEEIVEAAETVARRRLEHPRLSDVENIRWGGSREFRPGDQIIQVFRVGGDEWVYPHARVIHVRPVRRDGKVFRRYVFIELPRSYRRLRFAKFQKVARKLGLELASNSTRMVTDPVLVHQLLSLTSPEKLRRR